MKNPQQHFLDLGHELIVDNFAGGGGASEGIEAAIGRPIDIAINHDREAVAMHRANHPQTRHYIEDVFHIDPIEVTGNQPVGLAWFSPDCKHFSKAKGGKPVSKKVRGLAWVVIRWARKVAPRVIFLENVEEFQTWGPLLEDGTPCPARKGTTFRRWVKMLEDLGYTVEYRELRACDYGAPTIRKRLFLMARRDGLPIVWPAPTHGDPESLAVKSGKLTPWRTAAECIDWHIPCPSIFERKKPLAEPTMKRIARGLKRYVFEAAEPFIVTCNHSGDGFRGQGISEPFKTITAARDAPGIIAPVMTECANASSPRCMSANDPLRTICATTKGGHHALVSAFITRYYNNTTSIAADPRDPTPTITAWDHNGLVAVHLQRDFGSSTGSPADHPVGKTALVSSHLVKLRGTCADGQMVTKPLPTITASGTHVGEVRAFLTKYYGEGGQAQDLREPLHTVPTKDRFGIVTVRGEQYQIADIGLRMLTPRELFRAQGFGDDYIIDIEIDGKPITKAAQVRMVGNSVSPVMSEALVRANFEHEKAWMEAA